MKAVVLLSGGLDSSVLLSEVMKTEKDVMALSIDYGQLHKKELECAEWQAGFHQIPWFIRDIKEVFAGIKTPLLGDGVIPEKSYAEQLAEKPGTVTTYVPFRNGILLSVATAAAMAWGASVVFYAAHMDDAAGSAYPDCSPEFVQYMNHAIITGTGHQVALQAPFVTSRMNKADIVKMGLKNGVNFQHTWSCYKGEEKPCGKCGTCIDRANAFRLNSVEPQ